MKEQPETEPTTKATSTVICKCHGVCCRLSVSVKYKALSYPSNNNCWRAYGTPPRTCTYTPHTHVHAHIHHTHVHAHIYHTHTYMHTYTTHTRTCTTHTCTSIHTSPTPSKYWLLVHFVDLPEKIGVRPPPVSDCTCHTYSLSSDSNSKASRSSPQTPPPSPANNPTRHSSQRPDLSPEV